MMPKRLEFSFYFFSLNQFLYYTWVTTKVKSPKMIPEHSKASIFVGLLDKWGWSTNHGSHTWSINGVSALRPLNTWILPFINHFIIYISHGTWPFYMVILYEVTEAERSLIKLHVKIILTTKKDSTYLLACLLILSLRFLATNLLKIKRLGSSNHPGLVAFRVWPTIQGIQWSPMKFTITNFVCK